MKVSVYIPTRNRRDRLGKAVNSVLSQSYQDIELIVVDDASNDQTFEYLQQLAATDNRVRVLVNQVSQGAPICRNRAIMASAGDFVTGLDDDDEFLPHRIETFVSTWDHFLQWGVPVSCLYAQDIHTNDGIQTYVSQKRGSVNWLDMFSANEVGNQIFAPRENFISSGLFDVGLVAWQDLEFFTRLMRNHGPARLVDMPTYVFDTTPNRDRISAGTTRVRKACFQIASQAADDRQAQLLMLQLFEGNYKITPAFRDWVTFLKRGFWRGGIVRMMATYFN